MHATVPGYHPSAGRPGALGEATPGYHSTCLHQGTHTRFLLHSHVLSTAHRTFPGPRSHLEGRSAKLIKSASVPDSISSSFLPLPSLTPLEGFEPSLPGKVRPSRCFSLPPIALTLCRATLPISLAPSTTRRSFRAQLRSATEKKQTLLHLCFCPPDRPPGLQTEDLRRRHEIYLAIFFLYPYPALYCVLVT